MVLGVCGGIAAYKTVQVARDLTRLGCEVDVVLTRSAGNFVTALSFEALTGRSTHHELFAVDGAARHIRLGSEADVVCVAPATADFLARAAHGRADDLLATTLLVTRAPVVLCPAMNSAMWDHPQTRRNLDHVRDVLGYHIAGPAVGPLAAGEGGGMGRMLEPDQIVAHVGRALTADSSLTGASVLITAGPTREPVDPVRYLGNRSSGKMGYAIARAAWRRGARVTLVSGPTAEAPPTGVEVVPVETADEMSEATVRRAGEADVLIFAAAVADYRPAKRSTKKLKRSGVGPVIETTENPDVALATRAVRKGDSVSIGFALESENLVANAEGKLVAKGFDFIVANPADDPTVGMEVDDNRATLLFADGTSEATALMSKDELAEVILDHAVRVGARANVR